MIFSGGAISETPYSSASVRSFALARSFAATAVHTPGRTTTRFRAIGYAGAGGFTRANLAIRFRGFSFAGAGAFVRTSTATRVRSIQFTAAAAMNLARSIGKRATFAGSATFQRASLTSRHRALMFAGGASLSAVRAMSKALSLAAVGASTAARRIGLVRGFGSVGALTVGRGPGRVFLNTASGSFISASRKAVLRSPAFLSFGSFAVVRQISIARLVSAGHAFVATRSISMMWMFLGAGSLSAARSVPRMASFSGIASFEMARRAIMARLVHLPAAAGFELAKTVGVARWVVASAAFSAQRGFTVIRMFSAGGAFSYRKLLSIVTGTMRHLRIAREERTRSIETEDRTIEIGGEE